MKDCFASLAMTIVVLMAAGTVLGAEPITFEATVNAPRLSMDDVLQLTLTFTGVNDNLDPINLPTLDGFTTKYLGPSTSQSFEIINGKSQSHTEKSFIYNLFPNKVGRFQIPAISATVDGQTYMTKPIDIEVFESQSQVPASNAASVQNPTPTTESLKDKILIMVKVDKTDVYLNEQVPLTITLLVNGVPVRDIQFPQFDSSGFVVDDYDKPVQSTQVVNGIRYDTVEFKTNIYPNHLGDLPVGPVQIQGNILYKVTQSNPLTQDNNIFGAEIFSNFFDSYAKRPISVTSQPIKLHVSPLPSRNRPSDFSGVIGQSFDFQASVAPIQVKAGDPLTLKMDIKGDGNFKNLKMPVFQGQGFKSYEPSIKGDTGEKTAEEVIIPTSSSITQVPALHFSYFDTSLKDYKTITQGPFPIQVTAPNPDQDFKAVGFIDVSKEPSLLTANQFSLGKMVDQAHQFLNKIFSSIWAWVGLVFVLLAGVSYFFWRRFQERLEQDPAFARRLKAVREARQALLPAEGLIASGKTKDLYALLSRVLRDYFANKWHQTSAALNTQEILAHLKAAQLDETTIVEIKNILEQSDLVCFAGASVDPQKMRTHLSQTQDLIARLEKKLK